MLKKFATTKVLVIVCIVIAVLIGIIGYGLITRCDHIAIYKYCGAEGQQPGR